MLINSWEGRGKDEAKPEDSLLYEVTPSVGRRVVLILSDYPYTNYSKPKSLPKKEGGDFLFRAVGRKLYE